MYIISNGKLTKKLTLNLSVFDRGHQLGEGLFETIRVKKGGGIKFKTALAAFISRCWDFKNSYSFFLY